MLGLHQTTKQTSMASTSYVEVVSGIVARDGLASLFFRGLGTRLLTNAIQVTASLRAGMHASNVFTPPHSVAVVAWTGNTFHCPMESLGGASQ